jgi:hypothetical protein
VSVLAISHDARNLQNNRVDSVSSTVYPLDPGWISASFWTLSNWLGQRMAKYSRKHHSGTLPYIPSGKAVYEAGRIGHTGFWCTVHFIVFSCLGGILHNAHDNIYHSGISSNSARFIIVSVDCDLMVASILSSDSFGTRI